MPDDLITATDMDENGNPATKRGARNSRVDQHALDMAHDALVAAGATCNGKGPKSLRPAEKGVTDAPNLRGESSRSCANCAYFKSLPWTETLGGDAAPQGVCMKHDFITQPALVCDDWEDWMVSAGEKTIVSFGGDVKALDDGKVGGYLVRFSTDSDPDLERDFFNKSTDFGEITLSAVYYHHGLDKQLKRRKLGKGTLTIDDVGVWIEAQLEMRDEYEKAVYELAQAGKLGWSSGTAAHLVEREQVGKSWWIKAWPLGLDASLTPTPAEPRTRAVPLKSLYVSAEQANESPVTADGDLPTVTEIKSTDNTNTTIAAPALAAKEITMPENDEGNVTPEIKIDYELLASKVAEKMDTVGAAKSVPAVIRPENHGDPDPVKALTDWARGGNPHNSLKVLGATVDANGKELHFGYKAALQEDTAGEGGNLVPNDFYAGIISKRDEVSIPRKAGARVFRTSRDILDIPYEDASMGNFQKTSEEGAYDENEPTFGNVQVRIYKYTKVIKMSEELIEDEDANLDTFLTEAIGRAWGLTENDLTLVGSGSSTVQGVFVGGSVGYTFADTNSIAAAEIPALYWTLGSPYHEGAVWVTRGSTIGTLQGMTGNNWQFVSTPPYGGIEGNLFWGGKPYYLSDSVAVATTSGNKPIMIGNWQYYALVERRGLTLSRNPYLYQANGQIGLFCSVRMGGAVLQSEAFKYGLLA